MVIVLAVVGYLLTLGGVLSVGPVTKIAFANMKRDLANADKARIDALTLLRQHPEQSAFPDEDAIQADFEATLARKLLPFKPGLTIGTDNSDTVRITILRLARANRFNVAAALIGGALSTLAAVLTEVLH